ncbi:hypothetical protein MPTK1_2g07470 [Marchantia polymorpha subsp. ruderalis]|uniref:Uncharacterized protein n=1 Tax=Marchantia polymorpha TaxID=3197 RepID=A0A2R6XGI2_MARPO|nr:hypothetical protein MARPO_0015s0033 [Marchantia polymorpha]BBN01450.1 hypothetical protein Mp_2g07470 [Marchantia polymorpha subsp. ruderalis]|eukprot:PTQ45217.1 hypothetical protein MARPO_0015s0033 [Marchantia polymorpha]
MVQPFRARVQWSNGYGMQISTLRVQSILVGSREIVITVSTTDSIVQFLMKLQAKLSNRHVHILFLPMGNGGLTPTLRFCVCLAIKATSWFKTERTFWDYLFPSLCKSARREG